MKTLDICTTACIRPEILDKTYGSFKEHCFKDYPVSKVIINIDPVGVGDTDEMSNVVRRHFPDSELHIRRPRVPNFPDAFIWTWNKANADYVFNLEDDWECLHDVPVKDMISFMEQNPDIGVVRLSMWEPLDKHVRAVTSSFAEYNNIKYNEQDGFYEVNDEQKMRFGTSGHPSLYRGTMLRQLRQYINPYYNPEKFIRVSKNTQAIIGHWRCGVYAKPNEGVQIKDIGESWRKEHKFIKSGGVREGNKEWFTFWSKNE